MSRVGLRVEEEQLGGEPGGDERDEPDRDAAGSETGDGIHGGRLAAPQPAWSTYADNHRPTSSKTRRGIATAPSHTAVTSLLRPGFPIRSRGTQSRRGRPLVLGAIGVVFGDIGTSPLYAFK